jgi:hypothetical protein
MLLFKKIGEEGYGERWRRWKGGREEGREMPKQFMHM